MRVCKPLQAVTAKRAPLRWAACLASTMFDAAGYCRSPECEKPVPDGSPDDAGIRRVLRRGRSFCLRVCGCAPSAARPAKNNAASALSRRVRRMYARPGGLSNGGLRGRRGGAMRTAHAKKSAGNDPRACAFTADCREAYSPIACAAPSSSWFSTRCSSPDRPPPCCAAMSCAS